MLFEPVLHGHARLTADIDLIVDLDPEPARRLIGALTAIGFRPRSPVAAEQFADAAAREGWIREKGMRVFSLWDPKNPLREIDLFVESPIPFEELWGRSIEVTLTTSKVRIASIPDVIAMKRLANRPQDRADIEALENIVRSRNGQ